jgi:hypothetical protein
MINWTDEELESAGIDKSKLKSMVARFKRLSREMHEMGLHVYGQSGTGHLIHSSRPTHSGRKCDADHGSSVAHIGQGFDGGDW